MANTLTHFNHTAKLILNQEVDLTKIKVMLLNDDKIALFDATDTTIDQVSGGSNSVATITIASPGVVSWTAHGLLNGAQVMLTTTGALPTGLTAGTTYFVVNKTNDNFQLSATSGGSAINTSGSQSGTHTVFAHGANQVSGNGWTAGGETLTNVAATTVTTNDALLDADDISITPTGGDVGPTESAVFYDVSTGKVLSFNDFGETKNAGIGTLFKMNFPSGIIPMSYTPA